MRLVNDTTPLVASYLQCVKFAQENAPAKAQMNMFLSLPHAHLTQAEEEGSESQTSSNSGIDMLLSTAISISESLQHAINVLG